MPLPTQLGNPFGRGRPSDKRWKKDTNKEEARDTCVYKSSRAGPLESRLQGMPLPPEFRGRVLRVKLEPLDVACLAGEGQAHQQHCGMTAGTCDIKQEPREESSKEHAIIKVKTEPYEVVILTGQDLMGHNCQSTSEGEKSTQNFANNFSLMPSQLGNPFGRGRPSDKRRKKDTNKEEARDTCVYKSSRAGPLESRLGEMPLPPEFRGRVVRVKLEPLDVACLAEEGQAHQQHCGMTAGTCDIKQEPREESSKEHAIMKVKTEPYNVAILTGQDLKGHNCQSTSEDAQMGEKCSGRNIYPAALWTSGSDENHVANHTDKRPYKSDVCPAEFSLSGNTKQHKQTRSCKKPYKCDVCPAKFSRSSDVQRHKRAHTVEKPYKCDVCHAEFRQSWTLQQHKRTHTGEKPYKCNVCPAKFRQTGQLWHHKRTHTGEKPHKCDVCLAKFSRSWHLQQHKRTHTGEKPYKCDVCPAKFSRSWYLQQHKRTHTGEKPYKCNVCPAKFSQSGILQRHKRTHTGVSACDARRQGEKPYKCDVCPAKFSRGADLRKHMRTHTGEKPYKCDVCKAKFRQRRTLSRHKRTHTDLRHSTNLQCNKKTYMGVKTYKCNLSTAEFMYSTSTQS
ncbi:zinc finger protein ZFP2-like [Ornithodoros turicata]|uniref:zinc finger protein ZFP2-like n=1 Tax=Ornithodoros turicata TaxID=34597 RepID=UPI003138A626